MKFERLKENHVVSNFNCGETFINDFLVSDALIWQSMDLTSCTVLVNDSSNVIGFYTLSFSSIHKKYFPKENMPIRDISVVLLGMFGVDKRYRGEDLGAMLLIDAIKSTYELYPKFGFKALILDALNDKSAAYFEHQGFTRLGESRKMILTIQDIEAVLKENNILS